MALGLELLDDVVYEVIMVTNAGRTHVAPIGVRLKGGLFEATIYHDTTTYTNLRCNPRCTLNAARSGLLFYEAVYLKESVKVACEEDYWFVLGTDFWVGARVVEECPTTGKSVFRFKPVAFRSESRPTHQLYSRADGVLVEMLVHASRIEPFVKQGMHDEAKMLYTLIKHYYELVSRIAAHTKYHIYAKALLDEATKKIGVLEHGAS